MQGSGDACATAPTPPFTIERQKAGWAVVDAVTGTPAEVGGFLQIGLDFEDADDLCDALNRQAAAMLERVMAGRRGGASQGL